MSDTIKKCGVDYMGPVRTAESCRSPFDLTKSNDSAIIDRYSNEQILIAGAEINVFKLLGIHAQGKLTDLTGFGEPISSGGQPTYDAANAYNSDTCEEWRSMARGAEITQTGYLGYNFGEVKLDNGRNQYGNVSYIQHHITTIRIQQGAESKNRVAKARVEFSSDGSTWRGADIVTLPDSPDEVMIHLKQSTSSKFWRLRPTVFRGGAGDYWSVKTLELVDYSATAITNTEDEWGFLENRNREYAKYSVLLKGFYEMVDIQTMLARFGIETTDEFTLKFNFASMVASLGRPMVIGDIIEIPSQVQYTPDMRPVKKFMEVTATSWASDGFTPGWKPTVMRVIAAPMLAKQETQDIVGDFVAKKQYQTGFLDIGDKMSNPMADILNQRIQSTAREMVQERGEDDTHMPIIPVEEIKAAAELGADLTKLVKYETNAGYVRDAMPPGGAKYTEGDVRPDDPKDGAYHRQTYVNSGDPTIPTRLYRYSVKKRQWVYLEADERHVNTLNSTPQASFLASKGRTNINEIK